MSIRTELLALKDKDDLIVAENVVAWAKKNPKSDLHKSLIWDDRKAAYEFRLWQVRRLVAIHVVFEDGGRQVVSLSIDRQRQGGGYRDMTDVVKEKSLLEILMADAIGDLRRAQAKYKELDKRLRPIWDALDRVERRAKAKAKAKRSERRATA